MVRLPTMPFSRRETAIVDGIQQHLELVHSSVSDFFSLIQNVAEGRADAATEALQRVLEKESRADTLHRTLSTKIAEGAFFGGVREDMLNLLEKIDSIADSAKDASRLLNVTRLRNSVGMKLLGSDEMKSYLRSIDGAVSALSNLIQALRINKKTVLARVHGVEEYEELADASKDTLLRNLFADSNGSDPVAVIQLRDFIFAADNIADSAEDASDVILVLVAKGYA